MYYLYGSKRDVPRRLVATFDSQQQMLAYVRWATLRTNDDGTAKYEQGSALSSYTGHATSSEPLTQDDSDDVPHNPSPSML